MTNTSRVEIEDRRDPVRKSRRYDDYLPCGGAVILAMGLAAISGFISGLIIGAMVW